MSRNKKQLRETSIPIDKNTSFRFVFTIGKSRVENLKVLGESVSRIKKEFNDQLDILIIDSHDGQAANLIADSQNELGNLVAPNIKILGNDSLQDAGEIPQTKSSLSVWLSLEGLVNPINFNDFFRYNISHLPDTEYYLLNWDNKGPLVSTGWILTTLSSDFLLSRPVFSKLPGLADYSWYLKNNNLTQTPLAIQQSTPYQPSGILKNLELKPLGNIKRWVDWNISSVFRKQTPTEILSTSSNPPFSRALFILIAALSLIILPLISYNAGISGDEEKHYMQAEKVYNYFATDGKDTTSLSDEKYKLNYYGQSFDLLTFAVIKKLNIENVYEARHVMNGAVGALAVLCSGLLARILMGNFAGIITMLLLLFSPGFLGHAMNNPLDIPFAFGYIFTLLQLVRFLKRLPLINYGIAFLITLGIAFTISIRIGGLLLIPYIFMFSGLYLLLRPMPWKNFTAFWWKIAGKGLLVLAGITVISYFLSLLPWPYALQSPLKNPFAAMKMMENITVSLRVMFEGKIIWSDSLPASYIPKSIFLSIPIMVMAGFLMALVLIRKKQNAFWIFLLFFVVVFPVAYIIYKESNVYGAWRHLLFIYPPMVVMAGIGMQSAFNAWKNKYYRIAVLAVFIGSMINPAAHILRNYPNQYIYFNEIAGGVKKAYKKYETDYYMVSLKPGTEWIIENIVEKSDADSANPIRIVSNAPSDIMNYYFRDYKHKVKLPYTRYYDRGLYDWDYAIFFCNYIDPYQITHNIWPPKNTIYTVTLDGVKVCAVVKRENKNDHYGFEILNDAIRFRDNAKLDESIQLMENALEYDKHNEITYLNIAQAYILREEFDQARKKLNTLLGFYPNYEKAINLIGYSYLNEGEIYNDKAKIERAISLFNETIRINFKFAAAYHNLGLANLIKGDDTAAFNYFQKSIDNNPLARDSYFMMANILEKRGDPQQAKDIREYASRL